MPNRVFPVASKRADRCQMNGTGLGMRPDSTEAGSGVGILGPSLNIEKGEVEVGGETIKDVHTERCENKVASKGEEAFCWR